ncbi:MAG: deaminase [Candidatus Thiodiazotropha lotti]|nr:deaminase [Candidatus Thiodiazotropha lotti]
MARSTSPKPQKKLEVTTSRHHDTSSIQEKISRRQSRELVVAFSGPLGSGIKKVIDHFQTCAHKAEYQTERISLSKHIKKAYNKLDQSTLPDKLKNIGIDTLTGANRYKIFQDIGNFLRDTKEKDILIQYAIEEIILTRIKKAQPQYDKLIEEGKINPAEINIAKFAVELYVPQKTIYIIDQLKNDAEVALLEDVYGDLFYLIGILCSETERLNNLKSERIDEPDAHKIMLRDQKQEDDFGQQLEKTLKFSDYFIRNTESDLKELDNKLNRFLDIIHNISVITPTKDEHAMYIAHSAAMKSACLSKQVGASITNDQGQIIATGCNDVPRSKGGLYTINDEKDLRCHNYGGKCHNDDFKKRQIKEQLAEVLDEFDLTNKDLILDNIFKKTRIKDLIEFSRAIHAEMDAITSIARTGSASTKNCTLYSTTYPCHNCARHIVASGIMKVVYIEPYEKSLATDLHGDSISNMQNSDGKVSFVHFEGVSPRKYQDFFLSNTPRKDSDGFVIGKEDYDLKSKIHPYLDSYRALESKVSEHLQVRTKDSQ